ncbi:MAG: 2-oxoadipate dioxygenase/decarboxylase family protein, partial [Phycisphaerales bacterium]
LGQVSPADIAGVVDGLVATFRGELFKLAALNHAGFKDFTEGPSEDTPVLLRQDAYKALTEPVTFMEDDGSMVGATHTARFGSDGSRSRAASAAPTSTAGWRASSACSAWSRTTSST